MDSAAKTGPSAQSVWHETLPGRPRPIMVLKAGGDVRCSVNTGAATFRTCGTPAFWDLIPSK